MEPRNPIFGSDARAQIIEILKAENAITAKKLFAQLKKQYASEKTYQSVHKILQKMIDDRIIVKKDLCYEVNPEWISEVEEYVSELRKEEIPKAKKVIAQIEKGETVHFTLKKESQMGEFLVDFLKNCVKRGIGGPIALHTQFVWAVISLSQEEYALLSQLMNSMDFLVLSHDNYFWDKWASKQWQHLGAKIKIGQKDFAKNNDTLAVGDYVMNIFWDEAHVKWVRDDSKRMKDERDLDFNLLMEMVLRAETKIDFIMKKDKLAAKKIKEETINMFK